MSNPKQNLITAPTATDEMKDVVDALKDIMNLEIVSSSDIYLNDFQNILNRLLDHTFRMAVVGEFSSGKSTFLNALIGRDILKHGAKETTATITEIENVSSGFGESCFDVYYENGEEKTDQPIDSLMEYTATASTTHEVAREISKVVIKSNVIDADYPVSFIDTPGLNGLADLHREKTIMQIKNSHACIYLLQVRGLGNSDIEFLKFITQYQHNILFIQNFMDELKELEGETPEEKVTRQQKIIEEKIHCNGREFTYKILPMSARKALIARDKNFSEYEGLPLTDEGRAKLYEESGFEEVLHEIEELMRSNKRKEMQQEATISVALQLLEQLYQVACLQNDMEKDAWRNSPEARKKQGYEKILERLKSEKEEYYGLLLNFIEAESNDIRKSIQKKIDSHLEEIKDTVRDKLEMMSTAEEIQAYLDNSQMPQYLNEQIFACENTCNQSMGIQFENLVNSALMRIENYTGYTIQGKEMSRFNADGVVISRQHRSFEQEEDDIHELEKELAQEEASLKADKTAIERKRSEIKKARDRLDELRRRNSQNVAEKNRETEKLGSKPAVETKYRMETHYRYRGGLGVVDFIFDPKEVLEKVPYSDDSKQREWERKKAYLDNIYQDKKRKINSESRALTQKINEHQEDIRSIEKNTPGRQEDVRELQNLLQAKRRNLEVQKEKALQEYLRNLRSGIMDHVTRYLDDEVRECLLQNFEEAITVNKEKVTQRVRSLFEISFQERIRSLEDLLNDHKDETQYLKTEKTIHTIENTRRTLEGYLCQS